ncbi:phosphoserine aminotransferase [Candidatus Roizmanbacteria bacterium CG_4_10_14_0_2_um_filter_39_13]|uniref:phosphoserine transaminase n=1 Tax=Candidatus Roizmanbacteria bacterium CG_4_10_14_0_2_um_filter_39_13 TaxID=1974825 RepID=A0A2M7U0H6_9BACT|nr:MAG: phosphoserine aminotransferase [Candidatus Roizmanbacteria bacterium CG_4_10_14_0_2_um_filter_39_13]
MKYFTVGPSELYPIVPSKIKQALKDGVLSISHRARIFDELFESTTNNLRTLLSIPKKHSIFFLSSGTEGMERIIQNMAKQKTLHLVNGAFAKKFYQIALQLKKDPLKIEVEYGKSFDWKELSIPRSTELVCVTQNETSTGVAIDLKQIYTLKRKNPKVLFAVDVVSSIPYVTVDYSKIDAVFFSVQKGFGLPAGLGVLIVSPAAISKSLSLEKQYLSTGSYHSFSSLKKNADKYETPETPNILDIYLLNEVVKDMLNKGIDLMRKETEEKAKYIETFVEKSRELSYLAENSEIYSKTVHVLKVNGGAKQLMEHLKKHGFLISSGYGAMKNDYVRIANFPAHTIDNLEKLVDCLSSI